jgi:hypothetical protein
VAEEQTPVDPSAKSKSAFTMEAMPVKPVAEVPAPENVRVMFPLAANPVGVTNLISWSEAVLAFKRLMVSDMLVREAAWAVLIPQNSPPLVMAKANKAILLNKIRCRKIFLIFLLLFVSRLRNLT